MKEINDPIFRSDNPALMEEMKANDIRNSVLWTGKIIAEKPEEVVENTEIEIKEDENEMNPESKENPLNPDKIDDNTHSLSDDSKKTEETTSKLDHSIPNHPIIFNPNLKKVMPNNPNNNPIHPPKDVYYHTYNNPYVFQNPVFNMMTNKQPYYSNYVINIDPNIQHPLQRLLPLNNLHNMNMNPMMQQQIPNNFNNPNMMKFIPNQRIMAPNQPMGMMPGYMAYPQGPNNMMPLDNKMLQMNNNFNMMNNNNFNNPPQVPLEKMFITSQMNNINNPIYNTNVPVNNQTINKNNQVVENDDIKIEKA